MIDSTTLIEWISPILRSRCASRGAAQTDARNSALRDRRLDRAARLALQLAALLGVLTVGCSDFRPALPPLSESVPKAGDPRFPRTEWIRLAFQEAVPERAADLIELRCGGVPHPIRVHHITPELLVLDPEGELAPAASCEVTWRQRAGVGRLEFSTAPSVGPAPIPYDRRDPHQIGPFPDDYWLAVNPEDPSEQRLRIEFSGFGFPDQWLLNALVSGVREFDGFSPIAHITIPLSWPVDPDSVPHTSEESVDPLATVALFDITPGSPDYGSRIPFQLEGRAETTWGKNGNALLLFPSISLKPLHRYGLIVTRRVRAIFGEPVEPSEYFRMVRDGTPGPADPWEIVRSRSLADEVLTAVASSHPPIERADVAFAARFTIRSFEGIADDLITIRRKTTAGPAPVIEIVRVEPESPKEIADGSAVAALVHGTWTAPEWRTDDRVLARHPTSGAPTQVGTQRLPFVLALPRAAFEHRVPVVMYQHGNPGSAAEEVIRHARDSLAEAGFAVVGFTDVVNREVSPPGPGIEERAQRQIVDLLLRLMATGAIPDNFIQTVAEQLAFLRAIGEIAAIRDFAIDAPLASEPARIHGIDPSTPLAYLGISEGAHHGSLLLPFAPEIRAAALIAPGRRFSEILIHQRWEQLLGPLAFMGFGRLSPTETWVGLALIQAMFDHQDPHNYARFLYREPLEIDPPRRASLLVIEGLNDSLVPNHATRTWVRELGPIPQLATPGRMIPGFEGVRDAVAANVDARTTAAFYQYVPRGVAGIEPTPGCDAPQLAERSATEGHYCAQSAKESLRQRVHFFKTALGKTAPEIIDPLVQ